MDGLLVNLRKYRPRENSNPLENFITEAFAWLLNSSIEVQTAIIKVINTNLEQPISLPDNDVEITTQNNFAGYYPDMLMSWSQCTLVFEHKVESNLHKNQLKNYRDYIAQHSNDYRIILITAKKYQHGQNPDAALCWVDIYQALNTLNENIDDRQISWAITEFLALLKSEGLGPSNPLNPFAIMHFVEALDFEAQFNALLIAASDKTWALLDMEFTPTFKKRNATEQRIGLEFYPKDSQGHRGWTPGVFFGVIVKGKDHGVHKFLNEQLQLSIVFDFNRSSQEHIQNAITFEDFKKTLKKTVELHTPSWQLIDTKIEPKAKFNPWHPIILIRPMIEVFRHTQSQKEQVEVFFEIMNEFQKRLVDIEEFKLLVDELNT